MEQAQFFQIQETAPARRRFPVDGGVEPAMLATDPTKRPDQGHVADDIHHFPIDRRRSVGEFVMQRPAGGGEVDMANTKIPASAVSAAAMGTLTVTTKAMAISVAMHGDRTFQTDMF